MITLDAKRDSLHYDVHGGTFVAEHSSLGINDLPDEIAVKGNRMTYVFRFDRQIGYPDTPHEQGELLATVFTNELTGIELHILND